MHFFYPLFMKTEDQENPKFSISSFIELNKWLVILWRRIEEADTISLL